jgi:hypothetical protein
LKQTQLELKVMKRLGIYFLVFITFWVSTWMVTDIHDWSMLEQPQPHPIFSIQSPAHQDIALKSHSNDSHCSICSYDHGGHVGKTFPAILSLASFIPNQHFIFSRHARFWHSRIIPPKFRPPIAA